MFQVDKQFLMDLFNQNPPSSSTEHALKKIKYFGGISCLLNSLNVEHRKGLSSHENQQNRRLKYGKNCAPPGQSLLKKSISQQRDFMVNLLFYLLTLAVCIKLLLWFHHGYQLSIYQQIISYLLLILIIYLKAMVNVQYFKMDKDQRKYKNQLIKVKRDGQITVIQQSQLLVGDLLILQRNKVVRVDGLLLESRNLLINQAQTILKTDSKQKKSIWSQKTNIQKIDPFIFAGSLILSGSGQILVCTVGQSCSFRLRSLKFNNQSYMTPVITNVKKFHRSAELIAKIIALLLATYLSIEYLISQKDTLQWTDFLQILKTYSSFVGILALLQRLKVIRSLQFFLQTNQSGKYFRMNDPKTIQKLSQVDIIFLQESVISQQTYINKRDIMLTQIPKIQILAQINKYFYLKVITSINKQNCKKKYGQQIPDSQFYVDNPIATTQQDLNNLIHATFLTSCKTQNFIKNLIPTYQSLSYKIAYISNVQTQANKQVPSRILHICFHKNGLYLDRQSPFVWVKLQNCLMMEDILWDLIKKSLVFSQLYNTYLSLTINNFLVFLVLCWLDVGSKTQLSLPFSLTIIIVNRQTFFRVYRRVVLQNKVQSYCNRSILEILKFNICLIPYYFYVVHTLTKQTSLFIFLLTNSIFRTQSLLFKYDRKKSLKYLFQFFLIMLVINCINILLWKSWEEIQTLIFCIGLMLIFITYSFVN